MKGSVIMVQGTASSVGKSLLVTGLCRLLQRRGLSVAPFKAQNVSLNSFVTREGHEIGRAQATQAQAARIEPSVDMNPVLLKPEGGAGMQAIVMGKPYASPLAQDPTARKRMLSDIVKGCLDRLRAEYDVVVIEGAGSPAEINLRERDIVNMHVALMVSAPVLLVGDIDRGGVFAHFVGTLELLQAEERALVAGLVINKFRGDKRLLYSGVELIEERTGVKMVGIVPHLENLRIADEDAVSLDHRPSSRGAPGAVDIAVVRFPRISNFDDFLALEHEPGVNVRYVESAAELLGADLVILPGTKDTRSDLRWMRKVGIDTVILERARSQAPVLGICGGYQMLGQSIDDPLALEGSAGAEDGLGLLPIRTVYKAAKTTTRVHAKANANEGSFLLKGVPVGETLEGYEIHMGDVAALDGGPWLFEHEGQRGEGKAEGSVAGTLLHGLFDNDALRGHLLAGLGRDPQAAGSNAHASTVDEEYDRLADVLEQHLDMEYIDQLLAASGLEGPASPKDASE